MSDLGTDKSLLNPLIQTGQSSINGIDIGQLTDHFNATKPPAAIRGEDGKMYATNAYLDSNDQWATDIDFSEPVYYYKQAQELGDARGIYYSVTDQDRVESRGEWRTESEIRDEWEADEGMGYFQKNNPDLDFDTYMEFIAESSELHNQGLSNHANADEYDALASKYGIATEYYNDDGDRFQFNGSNYTKTFKVDDSVDVGGMLMSAAAGALTAGLAGPAISGLLGGAGTTVNAAGQVVASGLSKGLTGAVSNIAGQAIGGGSIDPRSVLASAVTGGLNPGGSVLDRITVDGDSIVPDSFLGGVISGGVDSAVTSGITQGTFDPASIAMAGLGKGGMNVLTDFLGDTADRSVEDRMRVVEAEHIKGYPLGVNDPMYQPLSDNELYTRALSMTGTGTSDLAGLIGPDGLITGIDEVETEWLNKLMGGGRYDLAGVFTGPDGKQYTDIEAMAEGVDVHAVGSAALNGLDVDGWSYNWTTSERTILGKLFDGAMEHVPGFAYVVNGIGGMMDAAAKAQFISEYGFDPEEHPDAARQVFLYGSVDETYTFSDAPRGDSMVVGQVVGNGEGTSTGTVYKQDTFTGSNQPTSEADYAQLIVYAQNMAASGASPAGIATYLTETLGAGGGAVLPGSNKTILDTILDGVLAGAQASSATPTGGNEVEGSLGNTLITESTFDTQPGVSTDYIPNEPLPVLPVEPTISTVSTGVTPQVGPNETAPVLPATPPAGVTTTGGNTQSTVPSGGSTSTVSTGSTPQVGPTEQPPVLPPSTPPVFGPAPTGGGGGGALGGAAAAGMMSGNFNPDWSDLFQYTTLTPHQKAALAPKVDAIAKAKEMLS